MVAATISMSLYVALHPPKWSAQPLARSTPLDLRSGQPRRRWVEQDWRAERPAGRTPVCSRLPADRIDGQNAYLHQAGELDVMPGSRGQRRWHQGSCGFWTILTVTQTTTPTFDFPWTARGALPHPHLPHCNVCVRPEKLAKGRRLWDFDVQIFSILDFGQPLLPWMHATQNTRMNSRDLTRSVPASLDRRSHSYVSEANLATPRAS